MDLRVLAVAEEALRPGLGVAAKPLHVEGRVFHRLGRAAQVLVLLGSDPRQVVVDLQGVSLHDSTFSRTVWGLYGVAKGLMMTAVPRARCQAHAAAQSRCETRARLAPLTFKPTRSTASEVFGPEPCRQELR